MLLIFKGKFLLVVRIVGLVKLKQRGLRSIWKRSWNKRIRRLKSIDQRIVLCKRRFWKLRIRLRKRRKWGMIWNLLIFINCKLKIKSMLRKLMRRMRSCLDWKLLLVCIFKGKWFLLFIIRKNCYKTYLVKETSC